MLWRRSLHQRLTCTCCSDVGGLCNFLGVMVASGAVAYGIIALLPVELIMNVSSGAGFAMVFALLIAAIIWNLGTWFWVSQHQVRIP